MAITRMLMIDNEASIQTVVQCGTKMMTAWQAYGANSQKEAIQNAPSEEPHVILWDLIMPNKDGIATLKELQSHSTMAQITIIFLIILAQMMAKLQFPDLAVSGVMTQYFNSLDLAEQIIRILHW